MTTHALSTRTVIVNPASASGRTARRWRGIVEHFRARGEAIDVIETAHCGDAITQTQRAIEGGARSFVVLGGDGTIGEVIAGCVNDDGTGVRADDIDVSVIHQGTGGDFARGLQIPHDTDAAIGIALDGVAIPVDIGVATFTTQDGQRGVRGFSTCSNVGMSSEVVERTTTKLKRLGSGAGFAVATVACLAQNRPREVRLNVDGDSRGVLNIVDVVVANSEFMGGGMHVSPGASMSDGKLDLVVIAGASRLSLLRAFPKIYSGTHVNEPIVRVERVSSVSIDAVGDSEGLVLDGEIVGRTPVTLSVLPRAIKVRVAPSFAAAQR